MATASVNNFSLTPQDWNQSQSVYQSSQTFWIDPNHSVLPPQQSFGGNTSVNPAWMYQPLVATPPQQPLFGTSIPFSGITPDPNWQEIFDAFFKGSMKKPTADTLAELDAILEAHGSEA